MTATASEMIEEDEGADHLALACGSARRTSNPSPRSPVRGTIQAQRVAGIWIAETGSLEEASS